MNNYDKKNDNIIKKQIKNGFTLIELLAVIIILGILMIVAIPSVTKYISDSRKSAYVKTAKQVVAGARNLVNSGKLSMFDTNATYYIPNSCIKIENGGSARSPYGEFTKAYVVVTYDGNGYNYYWTSVDDVGEGVKTIVSVDSLNEENIESDVLEENIKTDYPVEGKTNIFVIDSNNCQEVRENTPPVIDTLYNVLKTEAEEGTYARQYTGEHEDSFNNSNNSIYHYYGSNTNNGKAIKEMNNVVFAGYCWNIIRTTDTGGVKLLFNGKYDEENKCNNSRPNHIGYEYANSRTFNDTYYFSNDYVYDESNQSFSLSDDKVLKKWNNDNYNELLGKYTCMTNDNSCSELFYVHDKFIPTFSWNTETTVVYKLNKNINNSVISMFDFNYYYRGPLYVGYMYGNNRPYDYKSNSFFNNSNFVYGSSFKYENGEYKLLNTISISDYSTNENINKVNNAHYTCFSTSDHCESVNYIFYINSIETFYIPLQNGENIDQVLNSMLNDSNINKNNSDVKVILEEWYENNLNNYSNYLEDVIFCNDRTISSLGGWNPNGGNVTSKLEFKGYSLDGSNNTLKCTNITDKFSVSNLNAKNKYPIGLPTWNELLLLGNNNTISSRKEYFTMTPAFVDTLAHMVYSYSSGSRGVRRTDTPAGIKPMISLKGSKSGFIAGVGSTTDPYIIL